MQTAETTINTGFPWFNEYIDVTVNGSAATSDTYEFQLQFIDMATFSIDCLATMTADPSVDGRYWPTLTAAETTALEGKKLFLILLMRELSDTTNVIPIASITPQLRELKSWQS